MLIQIQFLLLPIGISRNCCRAFEPQNRTQLQHAVNECLKLSQKHYNSHEELLGSKKAAVAVYTAEIPLPLFVTKATQATCRQFQTRATDIFIASYPKSGTTWMQFIVYSLLSKGDQNFSHISKHAPFFESYKTYVHQRPYPHALAAKAEVNGHRVFKTHLLPSMMPMTLHRASASTPKVVYVMRNGKDVVTSFFHHMSNMSPEDGGLSDALANNFDAFYADWLKGKINYGSWLSHISTWMTTLGGSERVLFVRYEDLKRGLGAQVRRIRDFLELSLSDADVDAMLPRFSVSSMKKNLHQFQPVSAAWRRGYKFIRKGTVGDYKTLFKESHVVAFDKMVREYFEDEIPEWAKSLV